MEVKLIHKVPIQHKIEHTTGSKILTKKEKELFLKYASLKSGVFTSNEDKIIMDNWKKFCEVCLITIITYSFSIHNYSYAGSRLEF